jgi:hypothetical protein
LIHTAITAGTSRVAHGPLCLHAVANTIVHNENSIQRLPVKGHIVTSRSPY